MSQDGPLAKVDGEGTRKGKLVGVPFLLVTFLWACKDKFIRNEFVLRSRPDKFDRIKFEQPMAGPQGETHGWVE